MNIQQRLSGKTDRAANFYFASVAMECWKKSCGRFFLTRLMSFAEAQHGQTNNPMAAVGAPVRNGLICS